MITQRPRHLLHRLDGGLHQRLPAASVAGKLDAVQFQVSRAINVFFNIHARLRVADRVANHGGVPVYLVELLRSPLQRGVLITIDSRLEKLS